MKKEGFEETKLAPLFLPKGHKNDSPSIFWGNSTQKKMGWWRCWWFAAFQMAKGHAGVGWKPGLPYVYTQPGYD